MNTIPHGVGILLNSFGGKMCACVCVCVWVWLGGSSILYYTLLYSTLLYSTLLYSTLLYSTLLTLLYCTMLYCTIPYYIKLQFRCLSDSPAADVIGGGSALGFQILRPGLRF